MSPEPSKVAAALGVGVVRPHPNGPCADLACQVCRTLVPVLCAECGLPITDDDRHTRQEDGADVHGDCCPDCKPNEREVA